MSTMTADFPMSRILRCYLLEARCEFMRLLRTPSFVVPCLSFPAVFYLLFGVILGGTRGNNGMASYLLATYGVFGIMGVALFGFGVTVAIERERGFLTLKRALPMPPGALLFAKTAMAMIFASMVSLILAIIALTLAGVSLAPWQWLALFAVNVLGVLPFAAIGLLIATLCSGQASPAIINLIYLPMAFLSGLWMPLSILPGWIAGAAPVWPSYHLSQIALHVVGRNAEQGIGLHLIYLVAVTVVCFLLARKRLLSLNQMGA
ncbi:ABC transporter permease [Dokdonella sp.]|jgi:ABC-2 type transport system permease protein|uniref:ABC transporter permease n=1 Tax=Dokdonella sp. TaxID=2291710 RepID=UPI001B672327|nr:ABC transporter permease [Dokdonella sp.]MCC6440908.1 ABC transporter permease [Rhodanobacteraceae bacterium]MBP6327903.1 ABC transporter permease [Dokdonella sp.]MBP6330458.1 ABC transporter permease [Dokdonella sp.]HNV08292.1 ABC transporter permease [Dokdonella sp.]HPW05121.1 ABC transporter permease [Dokdonella sp.]